MSLRHLYYRIFQGLDLVLSKRALARLENRLRAPQTRLAIPFLYRGQGFFHRIKPIQSQWEIGELFKRVLELQPKRVLEIGTCHGGTLYLWCQAAQRDGVLISIDLPGGQFGGGYNECRKNLYQSFRQPSQVMHLLRADSHAQETRGKVAEILNGEKLDFLFIDADHTYEGVKRDFELYSPLVGPGGLVALHDVGANPKDSCIEVPAYWREIRSRFAHAYEFIDHTPHGRRIGIGVLEIPPAKPAP